MSDWRTYTPSDLLLFSPRVYFRLIERYNQDFWPIQIVFVAGTLAILILTAMQVRRARFAMLPVFSAAWTLCAWQFFWARYTAINWVAPYMMIAFLLQGGLLAFFSLHPSHTSQTAIRWRLYGGIGLALFGLLVYPFLGLLTGRSLTAAETFGLMPDPTAVVTLGVVLTACRKSLWLLLPIPLLWCMFSGLTWWAMEDPGALALLISASLVAALLSTIRDSRV